VRRADPHELPYAVIPLLFAAQQLIEGALWLALPTQAQSVHMLTISYLFFSNILWPIYVPVAVWMIESSAVHRTHLFGPMAVGAVVSLFFLVAIITNPASAVITGAHVHYHLPHPHDKIVFAFYAIATCLAPLLSSHKMVRLFGVVLIASMIAAYFGYVIWFASVWCFFAALLSIVVLLHFLRRDPGSVKVLSARLA
jgi:hypothetical protein